jgi:hypothetical protein
VGTNDRVCAPPQNHFSLSILSADGARAGINAETIKSAARVSKQMTVSEAQQILGVGRDATWQEVMKV